MRDVRLRLDPQRTMKGHTMKFTPEMQAVWKAPADFNRAARRAAGLFGRIWAWDPRALGTPTNTPPRYVRRHWRADVLTSPKTRRERKAMNRILRAMQARA